MNARSVDSCCLVGTDGVEPSSSGLRPDARTVSAAFPRSGRESNTLIAFTIHRCSKSTPYRSATTPECDLVASLLAPKTRLTPIAGAREVAQRATASVSTPRKSLTQYLNACSFQRTCSTRRARPCTRQAWGGRRESNSAMARFTSECLHHFGFDHHGGSGTNRTPVARFGDALVAHDTGPRDTEGDRLCADPLVVRYRSFGARVMLRRYPRLGARRPTGTNNRSGNSNPWTTSCGLGSEVDRMCIAAS